MATDRKDIGIESPFPKPFARLRVEREIRRRNELPSDPTEWFSEEKKNGFGAIAYINHETQKFALASKTGRLFTTKWPELHPALSIIGESHSVIFDGEIISGEGRTERELKDLMDRQRRTFIRPKPISYVVFDLLYLDGMDLKGKPYEQRRRQLDELFEEFPPMNVCPNQYSNDHVQILVDAIVKKAEGVIYKKKSGVYNPGKISSTQLKLKFTRFAGPLKPNPQP